MQIKLLIKITVICSPALLTVTGLWKQRWATNFYNVRKSITNKRLKTNRSSASWRIVCCWRSELSCGQPLTWPDLLVLHVGPAEPERTTAAGLVSFARFLPSRQPLISSHFSDGLQRRFWRCWIHPSKQVSLSVSWYRNNELRQIGKVWSVLPHNNNTTFLSLFGSHSVGSLLMRTKKTLNSPWTPQPDTNN